MMPSINQSFWRSIYCSIICSSIIVLMYPGTIVCFQYSQICFSISQLNVGYGVIWWIYYIILHSIVILINILAPLYIIKVILSRNIHIISKHRSIDPLMFHYRHMSRYSLNIPMYAYFIFMFHRIKTNLCIVFNRLIPNCILIIILNSIAY